MEIDQILGLTCKTHKQKIIQYCEQTQCHQKFICEKCQSQNKSHSFAHNKSIIPIQQMVDSYYLHHKMAHDLLKHQMSPLPQNIKDSISNEETSIKMINNHFEMQRQQADQLATRLLTEAQEQINTHKEGVQSHLDKEEKVLITNIKEFHRRLNDLEKPLNKSYEEIVNNQRSKVIQKEQSHKLQYLQESYDWFQQDKQKPALDSFKSHYQQLRDNIHRSLIQITHSLGQIDKDRLLQQARSSLSSLFFRQFNKQVYHNLIKSSLNTLVHEQLQEMKTLNQMADDMILIKQKRFGDSYKIDKFQMKVSDQIKKAHDGNIYGICKHVDSVLSVAADQCLKVWNYNNRKLIGSINLDCKTKCIVGQPSSTSQVTLGDSLGMITQIDYQSLKILHRFKGHSLEITKIQVYKYKTNDIFTDLLFTLGQDNSLKIWDLYQINKGYNNASQLAQLDIDILVNDFTFSSDHILYLLQKQSITVYTLSSSNNPEGLQLVLTQTCTLSEDDCSQLLTVQCIDGHLITGDNSGYLRIFLIDKDNNLNRIRKVLLPNSEQLFFWADKLVIDMPYILIGVSTAGGSSFCLYDMNTQEVKHNVSQINKYNHQTVISLMTDQQNNNHRFISAGNDSSIHFWKY